MLYKGVGTKIFVNPQKACYVADYTRLEPSIVQIRSTVARLPSITLFLDLIIRTSFENDQYTALKLIIVRRQQQKKTPRASYISLHKCIVFF